MQWKLTAMKTMHNPPHPGEFIKEVYLEPLGVSNKELADAMKISTRTLQRILEGTKAVTAELALKLSVALGRSANSWLTLQNNYDLWALEKTLDVSGITKLEGPIEGN